MTVLEIYDPNTVLIFIKTVNYSVFFSVDKLAIFRKMLWAKELGPHLRKSAQMIGVTNDSERSRLRKLFEYKECCGCPKNINHLLFGEIEAAFYFVLGKRIVGSDIALTLRYQIL